MLAASALVGLFSTAALGDEAKGQRIGAVCTGGTLESFWALSSDSPAQTKSTAFAEIPLANVLGGASGADEDTYVVTFSGEANVSGGNWRAKAQVRVDGAPYVDIDPVGPNIFHSGNKADTHSMTWCTRLSATSSAQFRIMWRTTFRSTATIDDYITTVMRLN